MMSSSLAGISRLKRIGGDGTESRIAFENDSRTFAIETANRRSPLVQHCPKREQIAPRIQLFLPAPALGTYKQLRRPAWGAGVGQVRLVNHVRLGVGGRNLAR